jgi:hypothetical protein
MTYHLPDLWDHVAPTSSSARKTPTLFSSKVPRFTTDGDSPVILQMKEQSLQYSAPSIESRPFSPFPILPEEEDNSSSGEDHFALATSLGGRKISQGRLVSRSTTPLHTSQFDEVNSEGSSHIKSSNGITIPFGPSKEIVIPHSTSNLSLSTNMTGPFAFYPYLNHHR